MTTQKLMEIAQYYVDNDISLEKLANMYDISKTTLIRYFKGDGYGLIYLPKDLQQKVDAKKSQNWIDGKATYGNKGNISFTKEELIAIANLLIEEDYTIKEIADTRNVSPATIYNLLTEENIGKDLHLKVTNVYQKHKTEVFKQVEKNK